MSLKLFWLLLTLTATGVIAEGPVFKCSSEGISQCTLKNVIVTKENYHFEPMADDPTAIQQVIISSSQIPIFGADICDAFPNLAHLEIQAAGMEEITVDAFDKCGNLSSLRISNQNIAVLDKDVFKKLSKLDLLSLNNIGLQSLHVDTFDNLKLLYSLSLSGNHLTEFPVELLKSLSNVDQLWLNSNELSDIDERGIVKSLPRLLEMYINDNDYNCHRVTDILRVLKEHGVKGLATTVQRKRYYKPQVIDKIQCLTEEQWSVTYYAKVGQQMMRDLKDLKSEMQSLKQQL